MTGSNYLLESGDAKILVDCGLAQGSRFAEEQNYEPFSYNPAEIQAVCVTHAHIDHVGRIPKLMKDGFAGTVYSTAPTRDFAELLLLDSEHLLRHTAAEMQKVALYTPEDIAKVMRMWEGVGYHEPVTIGPFTAEFFDAGHILGSAFVKITAEGKSIVFSGDLGNVPAPLIKDTESLPDVDYTTVESTYGARVHDPANTRKDQLEETIERTVARGGVLMIPAFAMERTQDLLYHLDQLVRQGKIPRVPIYMDSPLAIKLTTIYKEYEDYFDDEAARKLKAGDNLFEFSGLHYSLTPEESKEINSVPPPKIIIAGSGMSNGGRILHHERRYLSDPKNCLLIVGYQAAGTLGRKILEGAKVVHMFGEEVPVRCEVRAIHSYSAHADQPLLLKWLQPRVKTLKNIFVVQGEPDQSEVLRGKIEEDLGGRAIVPKPGESVEL